MHGGGIQDRVLVLGGSRLGQEPPGTVLAGIGREGSEAEAWRELGGRAFIANCNQKCILRFLLGEGSM